jgi:hypothetical protein
MHYEKDDKECVTMLKKLTIVLLCAFYAAVASGCSSTSKEASGKNGAAVVSEGEKIVVPEERPELVGRVKDIVGNEVTVYKLQADAQAVPGGERQNPPGQSASQNNRGPGPGGMGAAMKETGETETFIIPVGTPIASIQRGSSETSAINLTDIKKDQLLRIWKKDGSIVFVQVMGGTGERSANRQGTGPGNTGERAAGWQGFGGMGAGTGGAGSTGGGR